MDYLLDPGRLREEATMAGFDLGDPEDVGRLALRAGLPRATVANAASGRVLDPRGSTLLRLSRALMCPPSALYSEREPF